MKRRRVSQRAQTGTHKLLWYLQIYKPFNKPIQLHVLVGRFYSKIKCLYIQVIIFIFYRIQHSFNSRSIQPYVFFCHYITIFLFSKKVKTVHIENTPNKRLFKCDEIISTKLIAMMGIINIKLAYYCQGKGFKLLIASCHYLNLVFIHRIINSKLK